MNGWRSTENTMSSDVPCEFCGEDELIDLFEVWGRDFQIEYCCEELQASWECEQQHWGRDEWTAFVRSLPTQVPYQRVVAGQGHVRLSFKLSVVDPPRQKECRELILRHHRHLPRAPAGWLWGHAVHNGPDLVAIAWVGRPGSRVLQDRGYVEVNRCCVLQTVYPHDLARNACSMLYSAAAREAKRRGFAGIVTYTRADENGASVRAANFEILPMPRDKRPGVVPGRQWGTKSRPRDKNEIIDKTRWGRTLS